MNGGGRFYRPRTPPMTISHPPGSAYASPAPATSSATLNSILTTTASPRAAAQQFQHTIHQQQPQRHQELTSTVPTKRKIRDVSQSPSIPTYDLDGRYSPEPFNNHHASNNNERQHPNAMDTSATAAPDVSSEALDCICGYSDDDGSSVQCDFCSRWCHSICFGFTPGAPVEQTFECWKCQPRPPHVKERAMALQGGRLASGGLVVEGEGGKQRRRQSPGTDRKGGRRGSAAAIEGSGPAKRRRRPSVIQHPPPSLSVPLTAPTSALATSTPPATVSTTTNGVVEEEHIDVDTEPWTSSYVAITNDIIPEDEARSKMRKQARAWRGVTAVSPPAPFLSTIPVSQSSAIPPSTPPVTIRPLPPTPSPLLPSTNPGCLPPSYAAYTNRPLPSSSLLLPYHSLITTSSSYLREPTNGYASLGMPKPHVHLLGPPLGLALDARGVGNEGRFVRWGCRPNAVLRPVVCQRDVKAKAGIRLEKGKGKAPESVVDEDATEDEDTQPQPQPNGTDEAGKTEEEDDTTLGFAVFALRDLKEGEEVVLGWEWDDGHAIHRLPALLKTPGMFPSASSFPSNSSKSRPVDLLHLRNQLSNILHALQSTFTTCACGNSTKDCALVAMANAVDRLEAAGAENLSGNGWSKTSLNPDRIDEDDVGHQERGPLLFPRFVPNGHHREVDFGPLIGRKRGFRTRERVPFSGGLGGMEMVEDESENGRTSGKDKGKVKEHRNGKHIVFDRRERKKTPDVTINVVSPDSDDEADGTRRKGKGRAVDEDVDMVDGSGINGGSIAHVNNHHLDSDLLHSHSIPQPFFPSSHSLPNLEPRPPDPPDVIFSAELEDRMPPKMRKKWMHQQVQERKATSKVDEARNESQDTIAAGFRSGNVGLGIRFDTPETSNEHTCRLPSPPSAAHDPPRHQRPTLSSLLHQPLQPPQPQSDSHNETSLMPPPPMPAALDPTTISSQRASSSTPTPSPPSPHLPTPSPTPSFVNGSMSPHIVDSGAEERAHSHVHADAYERLDSIMATASPLQQFATLSLMSPAMLARVRAEKLGHDRSMPPQPQPSQTESHQLEAERNTNPHDEDVVMAEPSQVNSDSEHEHEPESVAEQPEPEDEEKRQEKVAWNPLKRVETVPVSEVEVESSAQPQLKTIIPPIPEPSTATSSPIDSTASTPAARVSPLPEPVHVEAAEKEVEGAAPEEDVEMGGDKPSDTLDDDAEDHTVETSMAIDVADVKVQPPSHFFDTDDEDEWKRQMDVKSAMVEPSSALDIRSSEADRSESEDGGGIEVTPKKPASVNHRRLSEDSSRGASPAKDDVETEADTEPPPPSGTTCASESPPPSTSGIPQTPVTPAPPPTTGSSEASEAVPHPPSPTAAVVEAASSTTDAAPVDHQNQHGDNNNTRQDSQEPAHFASSTTQPKVKLSLQEFARRKKMLRQELEATKSQQASPMSVTSALAVEDGEAEIGGGGATPKSSLASPAVVGSTTRWLSSASLVTSPIQELKLAPPAAKEAVVEHVESTKRIEDNKAFQTSEKNPAKWPLSTTLNVQEISVDVPKTTAALVPKETVVDRAEFTKSIDEDIKAYQESAKLPTQWMRPSQNEDPVKASSIARPMPSFIPTIPPPAAPPIAKPFTHDAVAPERHWPATPTAPPPSSYDHKPGLPLPPRPVQPPYMNSPYTRETKEEMIDMPMSGLSASRPAMPMSKPDLPPNPTTMSTPYQHLPLRPRYSTERSISPISPDTIRYPMHPAHTRRASQHEDGEIEGSPPFPAQRSLFGPSTSTNATSAQSYIPKSSRPFPSSFAPPPQSHSPPTGPRSFNVPPPTSGSPTPSSYNGGGGGGSQYRPGAQLPSALPTTTNHSVPTNVNHRGSGAPPSAPRALRQSMMSYKVPYNNVQASSGSSYSNGGGHPYIPRGPSADRERDRERDWGDHREHRPNRGPRRGAGWRT